MQASGITNDTVEEFVCNGQITPALLAATGQHCEIKAEQLFTDNAILTAAQTPGTAVTIFIGPNGTTTGKPKYTFTGCIMTKLDLKWVQKSAVSNSFAAKGILNAVGTFSWTPYLHFVFSACQKNQVFQLWNVLFLE